MCIDGMCADRMCTNRMYAGRMRTTGNSGKIRACLASPCGRGLPRTLRHRQRAYRQVGVSTAGRFWSCISRVYSAIRSWCTIKSSFNQDRLRISPML